MNRVFLMTCLLMLTVLTGCVSAPQPVKQPPVFYPPAPELPRIQFLMSFSGSNDIEPPKSAFWHFVTGGKGKSTRLDKPYGIAGYQGKLYICDTNATVMVVDLEKKTFAPLQGARGVGKLVQPLNISIDKDGNKYVSDPVRGQVVMFDKNDFYTTAFGPVEGWRPVDAVAFEGLLYVADIKNAEIRVFDIKTGVLRNSIGKGTEDAAKLALPTNLAFDSEGYLYVSDASRFQIVKLDRDGNIRSTIGSLGSRPGSFARPKGIALDRNNRLYAVDAAFNNVQLFAADGSLLLFFGQAGKERGKDPGDLYLAAKVAIDYDDVKYFQQYAEPDFQIEHLLFVTSQFGDRMVSVFGFGTQKGRAYKSDEELFKERELDQQKKKQERPEGAGDAEKKKE